MLLSVGWAISIYMVGEYMGGVGGGQPPLDSQRLMPGEHLYNSAALGPLRFAEVPSVLFL